MICKHDWAIIDKTILPSAHEQMSEKAESVSVQNPEPWIYEKKLVIVIACAKCGYIMKEVEVNPEPSKMREMVQ